MNRLVTRLVLAMMAVAVFALAAITISQVVIVSQEFRRQAPELRGRIGFLRDGRPPQGFRDNPLPGPDGTPLAEDEIVRGFNRFRNAQIRATVVGLSTAGVLSIALAALLARTIGRPLEAVSRAAAKVAEGDLAARVEVGSGGSETAALARNFNLMATSLESYEQQRRAMIADIAHELRTPPTAMQLRLEALLDGLTPFDVTEAERLQRQTALLTRLVEDLRTLSLVDAGRLQLTRRESDLASLAQIAFEAFRNRAEAEQVSLELNEPSVPITASVDPDRVVQVLSNLLDNALRVTAPGGVVTLEVGGDAEQAQLVVADGGPGIAPADLPHLFERFTQGKDSHGKSGLGLAIVHTLVTLHGGTVSAENRQQGAAFTVTLPRGLQATV